MSRGRKPQSEGKFITLEGGEGAGKTTQIKLLAEALKASGIDPVITREPGGAPGAEVIRSLLVEGTVDRWQPMTEALLHFAARLEHVKETIQPALAAGRWVVSDRFSDSTIAYQGYGNGISINFIKKVGQFATRGIKPHLTLFFDIEAQEGLRRIHRSKDRIERRTVAYHNRVQKGYLRLARREPKRIKIIRVNRNKDEIHKIVRRHVKALLNI